MKREWVILILVLSLAGMIVLSGCVSQQPTPNPTPTMTAQPTASSKMYSQAEADATM